tara:strand:+ start:1425 stop:1640 length:216 start_codon:yes stop_codon:yes gene_type:complete
MALIQTQPRRKRPMSPLPLKGIVMVLILIGFIALLYTLFKPVPVTTQEITKQYSYDDFNALLKNNDTASTQ